jgi:hypothetical protein
MAATGSGRYSSRFAHAQFHPSAPTKRGRILLGSILPRVNQVGNRTAAMLKYADPPAMTGFCWLKYRRVHLGVRCMTGVTNSNLRRSKRPMPMRCPYCVESREFKLMLARDSDECFLCANCGHLALPNHSGFKCPCMKCIALNPRSRVQPC